MKRVLYDSRAIPLDVLFTLADTLRGMFGEPAPELVAQDAPETEKDTDNA